MGQEDNGVKRESKKTKFKGGKEEGKESGEVKLGRQKGKGNRGVERE